MATAKDMDDLCACFKNFAKLATKDDKVFTAKASGKMVADCFQDKYKKFDVKSVCDASVFPVCKEKGTLGMAINKANCEKYVKKTAHELAKKKTKNMKIDADDEECKKIQEDLCCLLKGGPNVKEVKQSATGGVDKMTDASQYTGAHKERFDADGKGKGTKGRSDAVENTGYTGQYKGAETYGKK